MNKGIWRITMPHFCHANTYGAVQISSKHMRRNLVTQIFCQLYCLFGSCFWQKDKKLLSSSAASRILHSQLFDDNGAQRLQNGVACQMSIRVIDVFEIIHIKQQH